MYFSATCFYFLFKNLFLQCAHTQHIHMNFIEYLYNNLTCVRNNFKFFTQYSESEINIYVCLFLFIFVFIHINTYKFIYVYFYKYIYIYFLWILKSEIAGSKDMPNAYFYWYWKVALQNVSNNLHCHQWVWEAYFLVNIIINLF